MKKYLALFILFFLFTKTYAQTYTIPGATEQPAWVFPLWFEDALGNKDTLYFGYDPEAVDYGELDTVFGEKTIPVDTSIFNVVWDGGVSYTDSGTYGKNVRVLKLEFAFGDGIGFYSTWYPPLILRWDKNLFYSDALPFPDPAPAPRAWGEIITNGDMVPEGECSFQYPYIMTDTTQGSGLACYHVDSMIFMYGSLSVLLFEIRPWKPYWTEIKSIPEGDPLISIFPNPITSGKCILEIENREELIVRLYANDGHILSQYILTGNNTYNLDLPEMKQGVYLFQAIQNNISQAIKTLKL